MVKVKPPALADNQNAIVMAALKLSRAHTRWRTDKGSIKSFGRAKGEFIKAIQNELGEAWAIGANTGWEEAYRCLLPTNEKSPVEIH